jgi:hypothetical protein
MMVKILKALVLSAAFAAAAVSCAKYESEDNLTSQKRIREAWMRTNLGKVIDADENGIYILDKTAGSGTAIGDTAFCFVDYTVRDLDGNYKSYTTEEMARKMGKYSKANHYGPEIFQMGKFKLYTPVEKLVKGLREGGHVRFLLPPDATTYDYPKDLKKYYKSSGNDGTKPDLSENLIYDMTVVKVVDDMEKYQIALLEQYADKYYAGVDSIEKGFYMVKLRENHSETDAISPSSSVDVRYVGKLLDGFCFDTNIADSAKVYGLYKLSNSYDALSVTYQEKGYTIDDSGKKTYVTGVINGFAMALGRMKYDEEAIAFFWSNLAYGSKSTDSYPAYAPMCFYIRTPKKQ